MKLSVNDAALTADECVVEQVTLIIPYRVFADEVFVLQTTSPPSRISLKMLPRAERCHQPSQATRCHCISATYPYMVWRHHLPPLRCTVRRRRQPPRSHRFPGWSGAIDRCSLHATI
ncbi:hypothetical protein GUJ93_ZPchr0002g25191 [Zizania palustris]|uniref:Uncharacterized protein n=1 Tax=Zizania palustris TaxID=103762 RepID=A0A8J5RI83_ZIZPA|nr:hypothetical protein GUJ93_ZPchr0002g25191 [Zizania palustris]